MGKLILVTGGAASGKSAYAEERIRELFWASGLPGKRLLYLATMQRDGSPETDSRIARHRQQRQGRGFETLEKACRLEDLKPADMNEAADFSRCFVLLEDLGNLLANEMYLPEGRLSAWPAAATEETVGAVQRPLFTADDADNALDRYLLAPLRRLAEQAEVLLIVSNEIFSDGGEYAPETLRYIRNLGRLHQRLAAEAAEVTEVVCGIPLQKKQRGEGKKLCWNP